MKQSRLPQRPSWNADQLNQISLTPTYRATECRRDRDRSACTGAARQGKKFHADQKSMRAKHADGAWVLRRVSANRQFYGPLMRAMPAARCYLRVLRASSSDLRETLACFVMSLSAPAGQHKALHV